MRNIYLSVIVALKKRFDGVNYMNKKSTEQLWSSDSE